MGRLRGRDEIEFAGQMGGRAVVSLISAAPLIPRAFVTGPAL